MTKYVPKFHKFIDIGANLTDSRYFGFYYEKMKHPEDLEQVINRANIHGVEIVLVTGGSLIESSEAINISRKYNNLFATVGCHPTRCNQFDLTENYLAKLEDLIYENSDKVVAIGELGLDYDRIQFCKAETQRKYFDLQLNLCERIKLPLFLHSRACHTDFYSILTRTIEKYGNITGVVHSFTGTLEEANSLIDLGLFIGINGCSLKTEDNIHVAKHLPLEKLMIETDAPWCEIKPTHSSFPFVKTKFLPKKPENWSPEYYVKGRNEPASVVQVFEVLCGLHPEIDPETISKILYDNTFDLFFAKNKNVRL